MSKVALKRRRISTKTNEILKVSKAGLKTKTTVKVKDDDVPVMNGIVKIDMISAIDKNSNINLEEICKLSKNDEFDWSSFKVKKGELDINTVLNCGQSFRWRKIENGPNIGVWTGVFGNRFWLLKQDDHNLFYKVYEKKTPTPTQILESYENLLHDYFQLSVPVEELYVSWSAKDPKFAQLTQDNYKGIRILRMDPIETIFTFICSSNNFISRITKMIEKLCSNYGEKLIDIDGEIIYDFPKVESLVGDSVLDKLREEMFGYRASYIAKSAGIIVEKGGISWTENLRKIGYEEARKELCQLTGIGKKVADCICLMSLGYHSAVPVDTHIIQIAKERLPHLGKTKSMTDKIYNEIRDHFTGIYGDYAGWAQSILFSSRLAHLKKEIDDSKQKDKPSKNSVSVSDPDNDKEPHNKKGNSSKKRRKQ